MNLKSHFPIFDTHPELVYLDSAATTQKPRNVIKAITDFYESSYSNVSRGMYKLSTDATQKLRDCRQKVATLIGAESSQDIAFTYGATDAINKVAYGYFKPKLTAGHNIIVTTMEHHANLLPWQKLCKESDTELRVVRLLANGNLDLEHLVELMNEHTMLVAVTHISNVLGIVNPIEQINKLAHEKDIPVIIDAAQSISTHTLNAIDLDIDFLVFSGHKMFAPTGIGALYVNPKYQAAFDPHFVGGGMIESASFFETVYQDYPQVLEPGTPNIAGVFGLGAAIDFMDDHSIYSQYDRLELLTQDLRSSLSNYDRIQVLGDSTNSMNIVSFEIEGIHPHDIAYFLAGKNICIRAGHHCAEPLLNSLEISAVARVSLSVYNEHRDIELLLEALKACINYFE